MAAFNRQFGEVFSVSAGDTAVLPYLRPGTKGVFTLTCTTGHGIQMVEPSGNSAVDINGDAIDLPILTETKAFETVISPHPGNYTLNFPNATGTFAVYFATIQN